MAVELAHQEHERFDIGEYLALRSGRTPHRQTKDVDFSAFKSLVKELRKYFETVFDSSDGRTQQERLELHHRAIIGDMQAKNILVNEIEHYLLRNSLGSVAYPAYYRDLKEALYHEIFGFGALSIWFDMPDSQYAQVIGTNIFVDDHGKKVLRPEKFESIERVMEVVRALTMKDPRSRINEDNPNLEVDMYDGTRVSILIPPRSREVTITFRKFIVKSFKLEDFARMKTIPEDSVQFFRLLARLRRNMLITGPVRSGKSTFLKCLVGERDPSDTIVCVEKHHELHFKRDFPNRPIVELQADESELNSLFPIILRLDYDYLVVGELRSLECEWAMQGCERGSPGFIGTYHADFPQNIPGQIARLILDYHPSRNYINEVMRVADNIDFVIVMKEMPDGSKKVKSIVELSFDSFTLEVTTREIMRYEKESDQWVFKNDLSQFLVAKMYDFNKELADAFIAELSRLEQKYPMTESNIVRVHEGIRH